MELSTERPGGMGITSIPVSMVWRYIERFNLPDWWEPVLLQSDARILRDVRKDNGNGTAAKHTNNQRRD